MQRSAVVKSHFMVRNPRYLTQRSIYSAGPYITGAPVAGKHIRHHNAPTGRSMDKLAVSDIDADMRSTGGIRCKEHQVPRPQIRGRQAGRSIVLTVSHTGNGNACLTEHITGKTGTVKAIRRRSPEHIRHTAQTIRCTKDAAGEGAVAGTIDRHLFIHKATVRSIAYHTILLLPETTLRPVP